MKVTRSLIAGSAVMALAFAAAPYLAPAANAQLVTGTLSIILSIIGSVLSLAIFLGFWGTVYNFLVNHGHIQGRLIPGLPVF
ncbi:MAG: hypothetical protein Q4D85_01300 [Corynebacterium sp.]|uniref:hypothetical protein n=1 Tax=Corynebacterium sp. TaxID=1720 RepID=UPI0026DC685C|nr:hypothetical protein [Corynebacterium sp.]MDO5097364.1 hypothetical protein [Corynebacterium sp.]